MTFEPTRWKVSCPAHKRVEIVNESLIKYLAGLLDADGALSFHFRDTGWGENRTRRYNVSLILTLAAADTIDKVGFIQNLPSLTGMGFVFKERNLHWWRIQKRADLEMLLPRIVKHMVIKAKHWQWLLDTWRENRSNDGEREPCSDERRAELSQQSKVSRKNVGPIKPKNHPTWGWTAGYLDGDGTYCMRQYLKKGAARPHWAIYVSASAHVDDAYVLEFLNKAFGGELCNQTPDGRLIKWTRALGTRSRDFAESFLPNIAKHSRLKRDKINAMIHHNRQQRLSTLAPKGESTV